MRAKPHTNLNVHTWNANSLRNKCDILVDYILENDVDIMFLTETWLADNDTVVAGECTPNPGGGIGILLKKPLNLFITPSGFETLNFEHTCVTNKRNSIQFVVIYRPPQSPANGFKTSDFLIEFETFIDELSILPCQLVLLGDFNLYVDTPDKWDAKQFLSILSGSGFCQHITGSTPKHGHTLDLLISRIDDDIVQEWHTHPVLYSDHHIIKYILRLEKPAP